MQEVTVVIPAYNEQISVGSVALQASKFVDRVIVVDDGSTDNTAEIVELAGVELIKHEKNMGKGVALKTGFEAAKNSDIIVTLDADGQHRISDIPKLIKPIKEGRADIVNGSRYINGDGKDTHVHSALNPAPAGLLPHVCRCARRQIELANAFCRYLEMSEQIKRG